MSVQCATHCGESPWPSVGHFWDAVFKVISSEAALTASKFGVTRKAQPKETPCKSLTCKAHQFGWVLLCQSAGRRSEARLRATYSHCETLSHQGLIRASASFKRWAQSLIYIRIQNPRHIQSTGNINMSDDTIPSSLTPLDSSSKTGKSRNSTTNFFGFKFFIGCALLVLLYVIFKR